MGEGDTLKVYATTICDYSVKKASLDEITLVIAFAPLCLCFHTTIGCSGSENYTFGRYNMEIG